jgi:hypothetical protein
VSNPFHGRLYWSDKAHEQAQSIAHIYQTNTCIGRLDDGTEVEYNLLISNPEEPEPAEHFRFLGMGEFVDTCRTVRDETPLETYEKQILSSPYLPDSWKTPEFVERWAARMQHFDQNPPKFGLLK